MRIATVCMAYPRLEWPFIEEWLVYLSQLGVQKVFLGEDRNDPGHVWWKKGNKSYYHLHLSNSDIKDIWQSILNKCRSFIEIETIGIKDPILPAIPGQQIEFFKNMVDETRKQNVDWVLSIDIDEFLILRHHGDLYSYLQNKSGVVHFCQLMFDSRWDGKNNFAPRSVKDVFSFNSKVLDVHKYLYQPSVINRNQILHVHNVVGNIFVEKPLNAVFHHFRGLEQAFNPSIKSVSDFPCTTKNSLKPVDGRLLLNLI